MLATEHPSDRRSRLSAAAASEERIASTPNVWHKILGVAPTASVGEIRHAFRELALLHHPDKRLGNASASVFKRIQTAYEEGVRTCESQVETSIKSADRRTGPAYPVSVSASKAALRGAVEDWEHASDFDQETTGPDDIPYCEADQAAEWIMGSSCVLVDVREPQERCSWGGPLPNAILLPYTTLNKTPEKAVSEIAKVLHTSEAIVVYSNRGGLNGNCGLAAALLVDVFGVDIDQIHRLDGGRQLFHVWLEENKAVQSKFQSLGRTAT